MASIDIFKNDAFGVSQMSVWLSKQPVAPTKINDMGLFASEGITTTTVMIEQEDGVLKLVPRTPRGGVGQRISPKPRTMRVLAVPHYQLEGDVYADEVQNVRAFGTESELQSVDSLYKAKITPVNASLDATVEYARLGAVKGIVVDGDGSVVYNLFDEFGVTQSNPSWALGTSTTNIKGLCVAVDRLVQAALLGVTYTGIHAFCGSAFFDALTQHPIVEKAYNLFLSGQYLRESQRRKVFNFCGIDFEEYYGGVGATKFVNDNEAHCFPTGVPGLFQTKYAPADYVETVNTTGLPRYVKKELKPMDKGIDFEVQTNPLNFCTRPDTLIKLSLT